MHLEYCYSVSWQPLIYYYRESMNVSTVNCSVFIAASTLLTECGMWNVLWKLQSLDVFVEVKLAMEVCTGTQSYVMKYILIKSKNGIGLSAILDLNYNSQPPLYACHEVQHMHEYDLVVMLAHIIVA